ncbi:MAG: thiamine pyrophosphate-dependent enzyme [Candidatus Woesearchaeota archaeon]
MTNVKDLANREDRLVSGHGMCPGCGIAIIAKQVLRIVKEPVVVANATDCLEVSTTMFPFSSWKTPWIHNAFENAAATISGVETAYRALKKKGKISKELKFLAFGGDGGTYDIGLQSLSGALERGHDFVYICYDNEAYANTGFQRSSATPLGGSTTSDPAGSARPGKLEFKKDLTGIVASHHIPYVAQASISNIPDFIRKIEKAFSIKGPCFINVLSPCIPGWNIQDNMAVEVSKLAVDSCAWPLYEIENDEWMLNHDPADKKLAVIDWLKVQGRFKHLFKPENKWLLDRVQQETDKRWELLKRKCEKRA